MESRMFTFRGSTDDYIQCLENEVSKLRKRIWELESTLTPPGEAILDLQNQGTEDGVPLAKQYEVQARKFLASVPKSNEEWLKKRKCAQIYTRKQAIHAFHILTRLQHDIHSSSESLGPGPEADALDILQDYSKFANKLQTTAEFSKRLSTYSTMIFFCLCVVARENGVPINKVDECIRAFVGNPKLSSSYSSRLRKASVWTAQIIEKLEKTLSHRAPELFLLFGNGMTILEQVNKALGTHLERVEFEARSRIVQEASEIHPQILTQLPPNSPSKEWRNHDSQPERRKSPNSWMHSRSNTCYNVDNHTGIPGFSAFGGEGANNVPSSARADITSNSVQANPTASVSDVTLTPTTIDHTEHAVGPTPYTGAQDTLFNFGEVEMLAHAASLPDFNFESTPDTNGVPISQDCGPLTEDPFMGSALSRCDLVRYFD
ncbi:hypothetical protein O1611_g9780 [Lasiodiplodia mahajangana]|uniref:Uncharacterized protein n=1 Tax=Lasiodiplodia mahajangana TaxID=1108764 RepID=A0ACC2J5H0_9PEZI|nr:hypothetical protein O1611_g9780 [Lasiodiplodia mahajangana]